MTEEINNAIAYRFRKGDLVYIKGLGIYGYVQNFWEAKDNGIIKFNYIIKDMINVEHERWEDEIELVDDINDSINKAKCNAPLETVISWFNNLDKRYTLYIEYSLKPDSTQIDRFIPHISVRYGLSKSNCIIRDGKLEISEDFFSDSADYECVISEDNLDIKNVVFKLYMNIVSRLKNTI